MAATITAPREESPGGLARLLAWGDRPDSAAIHGLVSSAIWFLVGTTLGLLMSHELSLPDLFAGIPQLTFSRLRPAHVNTVLFGFLSTGYFGGWYFIAPRLCKTPLASNREANILLAVWNFAVLVGLIALVNGDTQGREYAEYPWYVDWMVEAALIWNLTIFGRTLAARREPKLYVSLWYIGGTMVWIAIIYFIGSVMWHPFTTVDASGQVQRTGAFVGLDDAVWNWFYGHNVLGLYFTTGGIALMYYLVPKLSRRPIYSHSLSLIGFWALAVFYAPTGQHHLLQAPIPNWLKMYAIIGSVALIVPVFSQTTNIFMTVRGAWGLVIENIPLRFILTGSFNYMAVSLQGSIQSLMSVNRYIHFTQWTVGHSHLALLGAFGFVVCGTILYMVPQIVRKPLWSRNLADAQYWLMLIGIIGFFWSLTIAGLAQGAAWVTLGEQVVKSFTVVKPYFVLRSVFGTMIYVGVIMQLVNVIMTIIQPAPDSEIARQRSLAHLEETCLVDRR